MKENLQEKAYQFIRKGLLEYQWGQEGLFSPSDVAKAMGISYTPVREATILLENEGLLERVPNRGMRPKTLSRVELEDLFHVREALDGQAARLVVQRAGDSEIAELRALFLSYRNTLHQILNLGQSSVEGLLGEKMFHSDMEFHLRIVGMSQSPRIIRIVTNFHILSRVARNRLMTSGPMYLAVLARIVRDHYRILRAIERRDAVDAERWARHHVRMALARV
jgi:DNA-binding GntR family transcriptional regulator